MDARPLIIVVDDNQDNLAILVDILSASYRIKVANNGPRALQLAKGFRPDLILLDIMMPIMSGFEVCAFLKADTKLAKIPVIFISAAGDIDNKIEAFRLGGVDYINKPFQVAELEARVKTHISLHHLQQKLAAHNTFLDAEVRVKNTKLAEAYDRLQIMDKTKNEFLELIAHEMRTPANGIIGLSEVMFELAPKSPELMDVRAHFEQARRRMVDTLDHAVLLAQIHVTSDNFKSEIVDIETLLEECCHLESHVAKGKTIELDLRGNTGPFKVRGNCNLYDKALKLLLKTALCFTKVGQEVTIYIEETKDELCLTFCGRGNSIDEKCLSSFFDVFSSVRSQTYAEVLGLSPALAERIFSLYGGKLSITNAAKYEGVEISLQIPFSLSLPSQ